MSSVPGLIYKIFTASQWKAFNESGLFEGGADDKRDGFIHLSLRDQVRGTLEKHFAGERDLVVAAVSTQGMSEDLKMEESRGGALFPHLFRALRLEDVSETLSAADFSS